MSLSDELSKLAALRASGTLSEEEFTRAKERLLNAQPAAAQEPMSAAVNSFRRSRTDRLLGGVCGGIGKSDRRRILGVAFAVRCAVLVLWRRPARIPAAMAFCPQRLGIHVPTCLSSF